MDFDDYWQENKGFVAQVGAGLVAFLVGMAIIDRTVGADVEAERRKVSREQQKLRQEAYSGTDLDLAREDNDALALAVGELAARVSFEGSQGFLSDGEPATPERYLAAVAAIRDELLPAAGRANLQLDQSFGLPDLSPTREDELERYLEGLDLVVQVSRFAIEEGAEEIRSIQIRLDSRVRSRGNPVGVERTRVLFDLLGPNLALSQVLARTQTDSPSPLVIEEVEMQTQRGSLDEARLQVTFLVPRIAPEMLPEQVDPTGGMP